MISFDVDAAPMLARNLLLVFDSFDDARNRRPRKAEEQNLLSRPKSAGGSVGGLQNGYRGLARTGPARDKEMAMRSHDLLLLLTQLHRPPPVYSQPEQQQVLRS